MGLCSEHHKARQRCPGGTRRGRSADGVFIRGVGPSKGNLADTPSRSLLKVVKDLIKFVNFDQRQSSAGRALALDMTDPGLIPSILSSIRSGLRAQSQE